MSARYAPKPFYKSPILRYALTLFIASMTVACGGGGGGTEAPLILTGPASQSTRVGQSASFTVHAAGTSPLSYRWEMNGSAIGGANGASYTLPAATAPDNNAAFTVTVANTAGSTTSSPAILTVGPRAPAAGDWRFQGIDLPASAGYQLSNLAARLQLSYPNFIGTPLEIGAVQGLCVVGITYDCSWDYLTFYLPTGVTALSTYYESDVYNSLEADLSALAAPNVVITSLDLEPSNQVFAVSWLQTGAPSGFILQTQWVETAQLQATASQLGSEGRVITAVSFSQGQVYVLSYGWQSDTTTDYDALVVTADANDFWIQAQSLAQGGYIITAMGGDPTDGVVLVGTKVQGDTIARPFQYSTSTATNGQVQANVYSLLRLIFMSDGNDSFDEQ